MNEQQAMELVAEIAKMLQSGETPESIMQQLIDGGIPQEQAQQLIEAAMQEAQGGQGQAPGQGEQVQSAPEGQAGGQSAGASDSGNVVEQALSTLGPDVLYALLTSWDQLPNEQKTSMLSQLQEMASGAQPDQGAGQPAPPAAQQDNAVEEAVFGGY